MATFSQLRAKVTLGERGLFDFLWKFYLREGKWPTHRDVYRDFMEKSEVDKIIKESSGALVLREQEIFQLGQLGVWCTSDGASFVEWTRKLIEYLRDLYYGKDRKDFITYQDVMASTGLSEDDAVLLGRTLQIGGFFGIYTYFNPTSAGWQIQVPYQSLANLPRNGSILKEFNCAVDDLAAKEWKVDHIERAQTFWHAQPSILPYDENDLVDDHLARRFQVFVSSTYEDLKEERSAVIQALLETNCIPVGMELFPAANTEQWKLIKRVIAESDYYVVIVAGRYGSSPPRTKYSYTEREFDYARRLKIPILAFYHLNPDALAPEKRESSEPRRLLLANFIAKMKKRRLCKNWVSPAELAGAVKTAIHSAVVSDPRPGWIRARQAVPRQ